MLNTLQPRGLQHTRLPCPSLFPRVCSNLCLLSWWCHPTISSSAPLFCFRLQSFPASVSLPMSWLFTSGGHSIGASASALVLPVNIQGGFPLGLTGLISLQSKGLSLPFFFINVFLSTKLTSVTDHREMNSYWKLEKKSYLKQKLFCQESKLSLKITNSHIIHFLNARSQFKRNKVKGKSRNP